MLKFMMFFIGLWPAMALGQSFPLQAGGRASCESLWLERNQILNEAGQCFDTALGQAVFDNGDCTPGAVALSEGALNRIARLKQAESRRACAVDTTQGQIIAYGRFGPLAFGNGGIVLGRWPGALRKLDVFPRAAARERVCTVTGLGEGDVLALRSGPDVRYAQIGRLENGVRVISGARCEGRWCFADSVRTGNRTDRRFGWFNVRWCRA